MQVHLLQIATSGTYEGQRKFSKSVRWFVSFSPLNPAGGVRTIGLQCPWKQCGWLQDVLTTDSRVNCRYTVSRTSVSPSLVQIRDTAAATVDVICGLSISHRVNDQNPVSVALYRVIFVYVSPTTEADQSVGRSHAM